MTIGQTVTQNGCHGHISVYAFIHLKCIFRLPMQSIFQSMPLVEFHCLFVCMFGA